MKKLFFLISASVSLGACATGFERCQKITDNPYGWHPGMTTEELHTMAEKIPGKTEQEKGYIFVSTLKAEWMRYGSMDACIQAKGIEDAGVVNSFNAGWNAGTLATQNTPEMDASVNRTIDGMRPKAPVYVIMPK